MQIHTILFTIVFHIHVYSSYFVKYIMLLQQKYIEIFVINNNFRSKHIKNLKLD